MSESAINRLQSAICDVTLLLNQWLHIRCTNPVNVGKVLQLFCSSKAKASDVHPACIGRKGCFFMAAHGFCCTTRVYHSYLTTSFNKDNSAVLGVSPLCSLMMDQVDGVQAETGSRLPLSPGKMPCSHCTINWWRCIKPRPCNLTSTSIISFRSHVFSAIKFAHAQTVCTRFSFLPPLQRISRKPHREPGDEATQGCKQCTCSKLHVTACSTHVYTHTLTHTRKCTHMYTLWRTPAVRC